MHASVLQHTMLILSLCDCWLDLSGQRWDSLHVSLTEYISIYDCWSASSLTGLSYKHEVEFSHTGNLQKLASKD